MDTKSNPENACLNVDRSKRLIRLGLLGVSVSKPPIIEFDHASNLWRVWTAYDTRLEMGTYIELQPLGVMQRVTVNPDDSLTITTL